MSGVIKGHNIVDDALEHRYLDKRCRVSYVVKGEGMKVAEGTVTSIYQAQSAEWETTVIVVLDGKGDSRLRVFEIEILQF